MGSKVYTTFEGASRMFRLNTCSRELAIAEDHENTKVISDIDRKEHPPGFSRSMRRVLLKKLHISAVFSCRAGRSFAILIGMKNQAVSLLFALSVVTLAVLHTIALTFSLYWIYPWLDIPMHFLGGAAVALGYQGRFMPTWLESKLSFGLFGTILVVLGVGGVWEVYEYLVDPVLTEFGVDTAIDLVMDVAGGIVGYGVARAVSILS
jgi:hypothetical protein